MPLIPLILLSVFEMILEAVAKGFMAKKVITKTTFKMADRGFTSRTHTQKLNEYLVLFGL